MINRLARHHSRWFRRSNGFWECRKAGHSGTLDPLATGVLPLCLNEATKLVQFLSQDDKEYRATMLLGVTTDTMDIEGQITGRREPEVDETPDSGGPAIFYRCDYPGTTPIFGHQVQRKTALPLDKKGD